ncbi:unnamed protein product [Oikopleura dioica]|uniref:C2H2-type domain-containing protein n=1 Tax=Oikopleura dioica TaxID=34765 RepID=E4XLM2_OIKDI|nr:unnamed protein product [Oikopleura dioica]
MGAVKKHDRLVKKYLKKTGRLKTLKELEKSLDRKQKKDARKPIKLSFVIKKAPEKVKVEKAQDFSAKKPQTKVRKEPEEKKTVSIPENFIKIAKKFGLPEEHLEFFYTNRDSFQWESKDKTYIHCTAVGCKHTVKISPLCLVDHMITAHNYRDIPCDKINCSYIAYSQKNLALHTIGFHGHGVKPTDFANHTCPYLTCKVSFRFPAQLRRHLNVHENRVLSCNYCLYRNVDSIKVQSHLMIHFQIKRFNCEICSRKFSTSAHLGVHHKRAHSTDDFVCVDCTFATAKRHTLYKHRKSCKERLKHSRIL